MSVTEDEGAFQQARDQAIERFFSAVSGKAPDAIQKGNVLALQDLIIELGTQILLVVPEGRNRSLALTALEDVQMRANKGIFAEGDYR